MNRLGAGELLFVVLVFGLMAAAGWLVGRARRTH